MCAFQAPGKGTTERSSSGDVHPYTPSSSGIKKHAARFTDEPSSIVNGGTQSLPGTRPASPGPTTSVSSKSKSNKAKADKGGVRHLSNHAPNSRHAHSSHSSPHHHHHHHNHNHNHHHHRQHLYSPLRRDSNPIFRYDSSDSIHQGFAQTGFPGKHSLSHNNQSIHDLSLLDTLIDRRGGQYEWARSSDETLAELGKRKKNGSQLRKYYENINGILDGWREVDEILESRFPQEVMSRFGTVEEVELVKNRSRQRLFSGRRNGVRSGYGRGEEDEHDEAEDTGYLEESEDDSDLETGPRVAKSRKRQDSLTARAASALSGFWFGTSLKSSRGGGFDESSALVKPLSSSRNASPTAQPNNPNRYGATGNGSGSSNFNHNSSNLSNAAGPGLATIDDTAERSPTDSGEVSPLYSKVDSTNAASDVSEAPGKRKDAAGEVRATTSEGHPVAVENGGTPAKATKRRNHRIIDDISNSESDDELDDTSATDEQQQRGSERGGRDDAEGSLDRKLANERAERKTRSRHRDVLIPGTSGAVVRVDRSSSAGRDTASDAAEGNEAAKGKLRHPGGISERDRIKLLEHVPGREREEGKERGASFAININLAVNVLLLAGKVVAVFSSNSVSLIASLVDSALDLLSTVIIFGTTKAVNYRSWATYFKYPVGKKRFEPLGVVIFSVLMVASFCQVLVESSERLWTVIKTGGNAPEEAVRLPFLGVAFMVLTIAIKAVMWLLYRSSESSGVRAVAQDAENDVVLNLASLIFPVIGAKLGWPALDPIGGVILSLYIIYEWLETLAETVTKLSGAVASASEISRALYLVTRFRSVNSISAFELYHSGDNMIAEADMVLPHSIPLKEAHDLGEVIVYCAESLSEIERVYVHLDYNPVGQAGHIGARG